MYNYTVTITNRYESLHIELFADSLADAEALLPLIMPKYPSYVITGKLLLRKD